MARNSRIVNVIEKNRGRRVIETEIEIELVKYTTYFSFFFIEMTEKIFKKIKSTTYEIEIDRMFLPIECFLLMCVCVCV